MVPLFVPSGKGVKQPTEEDHWGTALAELGGGNRQQGVWAKAFADSDGDEVRAKVAYLKARVPQLSSAADSG